MKKIEDLADSLFRTWVAFTVPDANSTPLSRTTPSTQKVWLQVARVATAQLIGIAEGDR